MKTWIPFPLLRSIRMSLSRRWAKSLSFRLVPVFPDAAYIFDAGPDVFAVFPHAEKPKISDRLGLFPFIVLLITRVDIDLRALFDRYLFERLEDAVLVDCLNAHLVSPDRYFTAMSSTEVIRTGEIWLDLADPGPLPLA
jgi:hypothetical protein